MPDCTECHKEFTELLTCHSNAKGACATDERRRRELEDDQLQHLGYAITENMASAAANDRASED